MPPRVTIDNWDDIIDDTPESIRLAAQGLVSQNYDRQLIDGSTILVDGTVYYMSVPLRAGMVVTDISLIVSSGGNGTSTSKVGLYTSALAKVAASDDQGSAWDTTGFYTIALADAYTVPTSGLYYVAILAKTATTMPTMYRASASNTFAMVALTGKAKSWGSQTGQTDLPTTATIGSAGIAYWVGLS